jgi:hypothetical protein
MKNEVPGRFSGTVEGEPSTIENNDNVDNALSFLRRNNQLNYALSEDEEMRLVKKIDWMLMPLMVAIYTIQYLDKTICE